MDSYWCADVDGTIGVTIDKRADFHLQCVIEFSFYGGTRVDRQVSKCIFECKLSENTHEYRCTWATIYDLREMEIYYCYIGQQTTVNGTNERVGKNNNKKKQNKYTSIDTSWTDQWTHACLYWITHQSKRTDRKDFHLNVRLKATGIWIRFVSSRMRELIWALERSIFILLFHWNINC